MMKIEIINSIEGLISYKNEWESILEEIHSDNVFFEPDWIITRWKFMEGRHKPFVLIVKKEQEVIGICPLMSTEKGICNEISFIGSRESGSNDFILRDKYRKEALKCILDFLRGLKGRNIIKLDSLSIKTVNCSMLKEYLKDKRLPFAAGFLVRYLISTEGKDFNTYFGSRFGKNSRFSMNIKEKKLKSLGNLDYLRISTDKLDEVFKIHDKRWMRKIGNCSFSRGRVKEFYQELAFNKSSRFNTTVDAITLNGKVLSFIYGFEYNNRCLFIRIAHDDDFNFLSPGVLVLRKKIEECFLSQVGIIDLGPGYEPYKARWSDQCEEVFTAILPSNNLQSILIYYIKYWVKIKLVNILRRNKKIYDFKKYRLGKLKYLFSGANITDRVSEIRSGIYQNGLLLYILNKLKHFTKAIAGHKSCLVLEKRLNNSEIPQSDMQVKEGTINDLETLSDVMNRSPSEIIRRLVNKNKCYVTIHNGKIIHYCWINCSSIEIPGKKLIIPLNKCDVYIYDTFIEKKYKNEYNYTYILLNILNLLYKEKYRRCYVALDGSNRSLEQCIYEKVFCPKYKIIREKISGMTKHNVVELCK